LKGKKNLPELARTGEELNKTSEEIEKI